MKPKLCKEACQRCYREQFWTWTEFIEEHWQAGGVWCSVEKARPAEWTKLDEIPDCCPYVLEHIVMGSQDET